MLIFLSDYFVHQKVNANNLECEPEKDFILLKLKAKFIKDLILLKYDTFLVFLLQLTWVSVRGLIFESERDHLRQLPKYENCSYQN